MSDVDPFDWPKQVEVGGRKYMISPEMSVMELEEVFQTFEQEGAKLAALKYVMNREMEDAELELMGIDPQAEDEHR